MYSRTVLCFISYWIQSIKDNYSTPSCHYYTVSFFIFQLSTTKCAFTKPLEPLCTKCLWLIFVLGVILPMQSSLSLKFSPKILYCIKTFLLCHNFTVVSIEFTAAVDFRFCCFWSWCKTLPFIIVQSSVELLLSEASSL